MEGFVCLYAVFERMWVIYSLHSVFIYIYTVRGLEMHVFKVFGWRNTITKWWNGLIRQQKNDNVKQWNWKKYWQGGKHCDSFGSTLWYKRICFTICFKINTWHKCLSISWYKTDFQMLKSIEDQIGNSLQKCTTHEFHSFKKQTKKSSSSCFLWSFDKLSLQMKKTRNCQGKSSSTCGIECNLS